MNWNDETRTQEAREWLSTNDHCLKMISNGGGIRLVGPAALAVVEHLYSLGAIKVQGLKIEQVQNEKLREFCKTLGMDTDTVEATDELLIDMPEDREQRRAIFDYYEELFDDEAEDLFEGDEAESLGQKSILFRWW